MHITLLYFTAPSECLLFVRHINLHLHYITLLGLPFLLFYSLCFVAMHIFQDWIMNASNMMQADNKPSEWHIKHSAVSNNSLYKFTIHLRFARLNNDSLSLIADWSACANPAHMLESKMTIWMSARSVVWWSLENLRTAFNIVAAMSDTFCL